MKSQVLFHDKCKIILKKYGMIKGRGKMILLIMHLNHVQIDYRKQNLTYQICVSKFSFIRFLFIHLFV